MYKIKLKKTSKHEFDEVIEIENELTARRKYLELMDTQYFYGELLSVANGIEQGMASFCNSNYA